MDSIIVVEDEPVILEMLTDILDMLGYQVYPFANADRAWMFIDGCEFTPRLLITDLQMPGKIDGVRLVQKVRQIQPVLPIVVASGFHEGVDVLRQLHVYWLPKPFGVDQLQHVCQELAPLS